MVLRVTETDLALMSDSFQTQAKQKLKLIDGQKPSTHPSRQTRDNPEKRLVQDPTIALCEQLGLWWMHARPVRIQRANNDTYYETPFEGHPGYPDLTVGSDQTMRSIMIEFKAPGKKPDANQRKAIACLQAYWADDPLAAANAVMWVAGKAPMFEYDPQTRKIKP